MWKVVRARSRIGYTHATVEVEEPLQFDKWGRMICPEAGTAVLTPFTRFACEMCGRQDVGDRHVSRGECADGVMPQF
jgi:hypothetical protein